jgi:hypothetical protein
MKGVMSDGVGIYMFPVSEKWTFDRVSYGPANDPKQTFS